MRRGISKKEFKLKKNDHCKKGKINCENKCKWNTK